jgi:uncharacterized damage-inducible protein DinB
VHAYFVSQSKKNKKTMQIIPVLLKEMEQEAKTTRNMLARIPNDKYDWQPHAKSMKVQNLSTHIAELPGWVTMVLHTTELDFAATPYQPSAINDTESLLAFFETTLATAKENLGKATEEQLNETWTLRNGEQILSTGTKLDMIRMTYSQIVHHRAQMGVYLRLLDVAIPGSYGPSADEMKS